MTYQVKDDDPMPAPGKAEGEDVQECKHLVVVGTRCAACGDDSFPTDDDPFASYLP